MILGFGFLILDRAAGWPTANSCQDWLRIGRRRLFAGFVVVLAACGAVGEDECETCGGEPNFPEAAEFLRSHGYPPEEYTVLLTWNEAAPAHKARLVTGYHVLPADGSGVFDLYSDGAGQLLDADELAGLGIRDKNWNLRPMSQLAERGRPSPRAVPARPVPTGPDGGRRPSYPTHKAVLELAPIDLEAVLREDEAGASTPHKGVSRIGVFQGFPKPVRVTDESATIGVWTPLPDGGRLWALTIRSPDAIGQRVHFLVLRVPEGGCVIVYNADDPAEAYGPYNGPYPGDRDLWSPTCFNESVVVECYVPENADTTDLAVTIDRIGHIYRGFDTLPWGKDAGSCNLDVSCYAAWEDASLGVGGIGTIGSAGVLWCTGSLLADTDPSTEIPYFLTANHCVRSQDGVRPASSIEVYWLYQTDSCNGSAPPPSTVPRTTGGADYLAGSGGTGYAGGGNDFTFLRLRQDPPPGLTRLGWSTAPAPPLGTTVTCIHHPSGDFKRISFGHLTDMDNEHSSLYHEVVWYAGTTEGGSSGSPMMLSETQQVIGQLWGGTASCYRPDDPDYYGRFDVTFPVVQGWLDPPGDVPFADFSAPEYEVVEDDGPATITLELSALPGAEITVDYALSNGAAVASTDYMMASGTLVFEGTEPTAAFTVTINVDTTPEEDETVIMTLSDPNGCVLAGINNPAMLIILDDDPDADGDGLSDYDEIEGTYGYVTDPELADTDGDGLSDYDEVMGTYGFVTDPTQPTSLSSLSVPFFQTRLRHEGDRWLLWPSLVDHKRDPETGRGRNLIIKGLTQPSTTDCTDFTDKRDSKLAQNLLALRVLIARMLAAKGRTECRGDFFSSGQSAQSVQSVVKPGHRRKAPLSREVRTPQTPPDNGTCPASLRRE